MPTTPDSKVAAIGAFFDAYADGDREGIGAMLSRRGAQP